MALSRLRWGRRPRRRWARWLVSILSLSAGVTGASPTAAHAVSPLSSASFGAGSWTYIVPAGVTRLLVDASGAAGAGAGTGTTGAANGKGGRIVAVVLVTAGESLTVNVGASGDAGGGNGGGAGGGGGGAGGGGTDLRRGSSLAGRLVVAGGGGGRGYWTGAAGGVGGATQGQDGNATSNGRAGTGGGAGTVAFGGTGGTGSCSFSCTGTLGGAGSFGQGGSGAGLGGGGGGGGYWGGGGGGAGESGGAGGGGGSSYVSPTGAVTVATEPGARLGSGEVVLTPDPVANDAPSVTLLSPDDGSTVASQSAPVFTIRGDDPDGDLLWVGRIEVRNSLGVLVGAQFTNPAPSGQSASAAPSTLLPPGAYTWTAVVTDSRGASSPPAPTRSFTVAAPPGDRPLVANGGIAFNGQATLDKFPCPPPAPFGTGPCSGAFAGAWDGQLAGVSGTSAYSVVWAAPSGRLVAAFSYAEWQCVGLETVLGIAKGYGSASAEPGEVQGKWQVPGEAFARDITRVTATFSFDWVRIGTSAVLGLEPFTLSLDVSGLGTQTIVTGRQNGAAAFVLTAATGGGAAPTCGQPLNNVQGEIAGTVPLAQVTQ